MTTTEKPAAAVDLPNGQWAVFRDPDDITDKQRRPLTRLQAVVESRGLLQALRVAEARVNLLKENPDDKDLLAAAKEAEAEVTRLTTEETLELFEQLNDLAVIAFTEAWSFDKPVTLEEFGTLKWGESTALRTAVAPLALRLFPSFDPTPEADSPTEPS
jgi:hypothetical protein